MKHAASIFSLVDAGSGLSSRGVSERYRWSYVIRSFVANLEIHEFWTVQALGFVDENPGVSGEMMAGRKMIFTPPERVGEANPDTFVGREGKWFGTRGIVGHEGDVERVPTGGSGVGAGDVEEFSADYLCAGWDVQREWRPVASLVGGNGLPEIDGFVVV